MKNLKSLFICMLLAIAGNMWGENKLTVQPVEIAPGETAELIVSMENSDEIAAYDIFLDVPEGIVPVYDDEEEDYVYELSSRHNKKHVCTTGFNETESLYMFSVSHSKNTALTGNEGEVIRITLQADANVAPGTKTLYMRKLVMVTPDGDTFEQEDTPVTITVTGEVVPPVNTMTTQPVELTQGGTAELVVSLANETVVSSYNLYLSLPDGVVPLYDNEEEDYVYTLSDRHDKSHAVTADKATDGTYMFAVASSKSKTLTGTSGEVIRITLKADAALAAGNYTAQIVNIAVSDADAVTYDVDDVEFNIIVNEDPNKPKDVSDLIVNNKFFDGSNGWTMENLRVRDYTEGTNVLTFSGNSPFELNQTIANVPAGLYRLTVHNYYRAGSQENEEGFIARGEAIPHNTTLYVESTTDDNRYSKKVMTLTEGAQAVSYHSTDKTTNGGLYVPDGAAGAQSWYVAGQYLNEILFNVFEENGTIKIGLSKTENIGSDYGPIGAWKLYRLGDADAEQAIPDEKPEPKPELKPGDDATSYIVNPSFETGDMTGWSVEASSDTGVRANSNATYATEGCDGDYLFNTWWKGNPVTQTITGLPNGLFELKALVANDAGEGNSDKPCIYLIANGTHDAPVQGTSKAKFTEGTLRFYVTDGTATIGVVGGNTDGTYREDGYYWYKCDNFRLTYVEALPAIEDVEIPEGKMSTAAQQAITAAKEAGDVVALLKAVEEAKASIAAYAKANEAIEKARAILAGTNVTTAAATETFNGAIETAWTAYDEGTLTTEAANAVGAQLGTVVTGWRAGAEGAAVKFMESAYGLNGFDAPLYVNTWSVEGDNDGSNFSVPFYEYFVDGNATLAANTFTTIVEGLQAGEYEVSAWVRVQMKDGETVPTGVTLNANDGEAVEALGTEATSANLYLKETKATAMVGEDGVLRINVNVLENNNIHWLAFKNVKYTFIPDTPETAYERALATIEDGGGYRIFFQNTEGKKFYLNTTGYLVADAKQAATFTFNKVVADGTLYETGINLGCKFTNPSLTGGSSGDVIQNGHINVGSNNRNDWERQVFFLKGGKYAVRATNANSENWGANTYWTVTNQEAELPNADYSLDMSYVWQIEANVDNRPAAFAKVQTWISKLQGVKGLIQDATKFTSNAKESNEGSYAALLDGEYTTFFHSSWSAAVADDHYLQAEIEEPVTDFYFYFKKRSQNNNNRPTDIVITASNDGETFSDVTEINEGLPTAATPLDYMSAKISMVDANKFIRFTILDTNNHAAEGNGHKFFTFSEFYILPSDELTDAALAYTACTSYTDLDDEDVPAIDALDEQITALALQKELAEDLIALKASIEKLQAKIDATDTYSDKGNAAATATAALNEVKATIYTSIEAINEAKARINEIARNFFAGIKAVKDIDITDYYIVNPTPMKIDGWEGDAFGTASNGVCEYWDKAAVGFHQSVALPVGDYKLTVVALQRSNMTGYVYAGENTATIVQVANSVANSRAEAANWFAQGNGLNEIYFQNLTGEDVEIGLRTDANTGDHWTVWQSFKMEMVADALRPAALLALQNALKEADALLSNTDAVGSELFQISQDAYDTFASIVNTQQGVLDDENATSAQLNAAAVAVNEAIEVYKAVPVNAPDAEKQYVLQLKDSELYLSLYSEDDGEGTVKTGVRLSAEAYPLTWVAGDNGGYYLTNNEEGLFVGIEGSNVWTMSALEAKKVELKPTAVTLEETLFYTLNEVNGLIAPDDVEDGAPCYADKTVAGAGARAYWTIAEYQEPDAIKAVETTTKEGVIYDLSGRRVTKVDQKGVFIINGRKIVK